MKNIQNTSYKRVDMRKYNTLQDLLIGRGYSQFIIKSYQSHLTRPWELVFRAGKQGHFLETDSLLRNLKGQNLNLYKKVKKLFPEYMI